MQYLASLISSQTIRQFMLFAGLGIAGTIIQYAVLILLVELADTNPVVATAVGFMLGAIVNYLLSYLLVFKSNKRHTEAFIKFVIVASIGLLLNIAIMYLGTVIFKWHYFLSQIIATGTVLLWNFTLNKVWTFSHRAST